MLKFMKDCQLFLKLCGYCAYDTADALRYRWSSAIHHIISFLYVYFIGACLAFVCDGEQPLDERIMTSLSVVAFSEQAGAHITLTAQRSNIFDFFQHYEMITNQSKF